MLFPKCFLVLPRAQTFVVDTNFASFTQENVSENFQKHFLCPDAQHRVATDGNSQYNVAAKGDSLTFRVFHPGDPRYSGVILRRLKICLARCS